MTVLRVFLFGHVRITYADQPAPVKVTPACQALLAYLLLQRQHSHARELLAGLFWGDYSQERARNCLNTALWRLRRVLEPETVAVPGSFLLTTPSEVGFNPDSDYWLDVAAFEEQAGQALATPVSAMAADTARQLENALQLYTGELLEGLYDDWALYDRERLRRLYLNGLAHLLHYYRLHQAWEAGLACGRRILAQDPLREEIHRDMMRLYLDNGQRVLAVRQYELCREALATELGIAPMAETQQLYAQIIQDDGLVQTPLPSPEAATTGSQQVLQQLQLALHSFNEAQQQLQQAMQMAIRFIKHQEEKEKEKENSSSRLG